MHFRFPCILILLLAFANLKSQQLPVTLYSSYEGNQLVGGSGIFQDKKGSIWFLSGYDVIRYDGHRFKTFAPAKNAKLDYVFGLLEVNEEIWVRSYPMTLKIAGDSLVPVTSLAPSFKLQEHTFHRGKNYLLENSGLYLFEQDSATLICRDTALTMGVDATLIAYNDSILLSYSNRGHLVIFDLNKKSLSLVPLGITGMRRDTEDNIFLLMNRKEFYQLKKITNSNGKFEVSSDLYFSMPGENLSLGQFVIDRQKNIWVREQSKRLVRISASLEITSYTETQGLPSLIFQDLMIDREDNLWIIFSTGICKINSILWERFTRNEGLILNHINNVYRDGEYIFLSTDDGFNVYAENRMWTLMHHGKPFNCNSFLAKDKQIYYVKDSILFRASFDEKSKQVVNDQKLTRIPRRSSELKTDSRGTLFIGTNEGLYAWYHNSLLGLISDPIYFREIAIDRRNHIWLGEYGGPVQHYSIQYDKEQLIVEKIETVKAPENMSALNLVRALEEDAQGNIVVGTRYNGLFYLSVEKDKVSSITHFGPEQGMSSKSVWSIAPSMDGRVWVSTAMGLNNIKKLSNDSWEVINEGRLRSINTSSVVVFDDSRDRVWVVTHPGIVYFDAAKKIPSYPFNAYVNFRTPGIKKAGSEFSYKENDFIFEFSTNSYFNEKAMQYSYRLVKNGNEDWSAASTLESVNFSSLNPGKYIFQVKALNANKEWSTNQAEYSFSILPPFWQRGWFIILVILVVGAGLYALYRYRIQKMKELFEVRQVIASDLHDEIGSTLTSIHILSKVSQISMESDQQKALSLLDKVIDQSGQIQQNMSDIVWAIRPDNDKMENMVIRMREYLSHSLEPKN
ncbi:MAG TPA: triple tyrosine motif-containing protein, partial [Chitinophagaceae bacterium]